MSLPIYLTIRNPKVFRIGKSGMERVALSKYEAVQAIMHDIRILDNLDSSYEDTKKEIIRRYKLDNNDFEQIYKLHLMPK
jgi:hypothetical protein